MKRFLFALSICAACFFSAHAQIQNVIVETYYVSDANDATDSTNYFADTAYAMPVLPAGSKTYRVYIELQPGSRLKKIYGDVNHVLKISSTQNFYNNIDRPNAYFGYSINKSWFASNPTIALDSWLTLGLAATTRSGILKINDNDGCLAEIANNSPGLLHNNDLSAGIPLMTSDGLAPGNISAPSWVDYGFRNNISGGTDTTIFGPVNVGSSFISNEAYLQLNSGAIGAAADSNKVLVAQLTTIGEISFELNVEVMVPNIATPVKYVARLASGESNSDTLKVSPYLVYPPVCGCTDPNYLEYSANYACNNPDSCHTRIIFGCMDTLACNYNPQANFNISSLCCYPGFCQDRDIALVCAALGAKRLQLFPNPAHDEMRMEIFAAGNEETKYAIYDSFGKLVLEKNISIASGSSRLQLDISNLPTGVYMLRLYDGNSSVAKMFLKN